MSDSFKSQNLNPLSTQVPIPSETPTNVDLSQFPGEVLRSSAVETLIQQNEDLMARLKVNLRRISQLEDKLSDGEKFQQKFKFHFENLREQSLILKEKCSSLEARKDDQISELNKMAERNKALEVEYARMYTESKEQKQKLLKSIDELSKRTTRLLKYRKNISVVAKNLRGSNRRLENQLIKEQTALTATESTLAGLKKQLSDSTEYIQTQGFTYKKEMDQLTNSYEETIGKLEKELEITKHENSKLKPFLDENIKLQNQKIETNRNYSEQIEAVRNENQTLTSEITELKIKHKNQDKEIQNLRRLEKELAAAQSENHKQKVQLETAQKLWSEAQKDTEELSERNTSLQKLNQNLSMNLNKYRLEIQNLKNQVRTSHTSNFDRAQATQISNQNNSAMKESKKSDIPDRIESLIAEIEIGQ